MSVHPAFDDGEGDSGLSQDERIGIIIGSVCGVISTIATVLGVLYAKKALQASNSGSVSSSSLGGNQQQSSSSSSAFFSSKSIASKGYGETATKTVLSKNL